MRRPLPALLAHLLLALCLSALAAAAQAPDTDGDGLTDAQELQLGTDPAFAESVDVVSTDPTFAEGDPSRAGASDDAGRDITEVAFGNVAGNRYLWRITFAEPFQPRSVLHLYVNADGDTATGRQNGSGVEYMLTTVAGRPTVTAYAADGQTVAASAPRAVFDGNQVWYCADVDLKQADGQSVYTLYVLCHDTEPPNGGDRTATFEVRGAGESERAKIRLERDMDTSAGFRPLEGLQTIFALKDDPHNLALSVRDAELDGFRQDTFTEYRGISALLSGGAGSSLTYTIPEARRAFIGVQVYDGAGAEKLRVELNGRRLGYVVADRDANTLVLWSSEQPVDLKAGDRVTLTALDTGAAYRIEELLLLASPPPAWQPTYALSRIDVSREGRVTFLSTWPTAATVQFGPTPARERSVTEERAVNNHRIHLPELPSEGALHYRIVAPTPGGEPVVAEGRLESLAPPALPAGSATRERVPLTLLNAGHVPAGGWPVTSGIPLPQGALFNPDRARLLAGETAVPLQTSVTGRWLDGSVRWLLLDFIAQPDHGDYVLEFGSEVQPTPPQGLTVDAGADAVTIDNGRLRLEIPRDGAGGVFSRLSLDGERVTRAGDGELTLVDAEGKVYTSGAPESVEVLEAGPGRAVVLVTGHHLDAAGNPLFGYEFEIHAYAGHPALRVVHRWRHDHEADKFTSVRSMSWRIPTPAARFALGGEAPAEGAVGEGASVRQMVDDRFEMSGAADAAGTRAAGWAAVDGGKLALVPREFWQHYPKAMHVDADGITYDIMPALDGVDYGERAEPEYRLYYYLQDGLYKLKLGTTKRHEAWLTLGLDPAAAQPAVDQRPFLIAAPEWHQRTGSFGDIAVTSQQTFPGYEQAVVQALEGYLKNRESQHEFGMLNFGDWWGERGINWGNIEYDTQHAFLMHFARSGDWRWFLAGEQAELHNADVDTVWHGPNAGFVYSHSIGHVGEYYDQSPVEGQGSPRGGFSVSHTWCEGHAEHHYLTGDRLSREAAVRIGDAYSRKYDTSYDWSNCRVPGWHLLLTMAVYQLTEDPYYLNTAYQILDSVEERQTSDGGWERQLVPGHCVHEPNHRGNAGFMVGVLLAGLRSMHEVTGDDRIPPIMHRASRFMIDDMWIPEIDGFRYTSCPTSSRSTFSNVLLAEGMAYADRFIPDPVVQDVLVRAAEAGFRDVSPFGKSISLEIRNAPRALYDMEQVKRRWLDQGLPQPNAGGDRLLEPGSGSEVVLDGSASSDRGDGKLTAWRWDLGDGTTAEGPTVRHRYAQPGAYTVTLTVTDDAGNEASESITVTVPPAAVLDADPERTVMAEAESFSGQGGGQVEIVDRAGHSGRMITKWHADLGHWLEWKLPVKQAGEYLVVLRYCTSSPNPRRKLEIDGQVPRPDCESIAFEPTGGFGTQATDWRYLVVGGEDNPLRLKLEPGDHTLRLTNLGDGLGLDYVILVPVG